jgi:beta-lactamase regulating signal transducer with metallopeptidase domain
MLDKLFLQILNMSYTASFVILLVLLTRMLLKRVPKIFSYALWSVVLFRLISPFSFESSLSLLPAESNPIPIDIMVAQTPQINTGIPVINDAINSILPAAVVDSSINPIQIWIFTGRTLWLMGIAILLAYGVLSLMKLQNRLKNAKHEDKNIYISKNVETPFVMGMIKPKIFIPESLCFDEKSYILLHEQTHIHRFDHIVKIVSFFVLCLHWFNPFVWIAFFLSARDMEMSCDESVIKKLGSDVKKNYSSSLLSLATGRRMIGGMPLAFGEGDTKDRIKNVLNYKKPILWLIILGVITVGVVGVGLLANPKQKDIPSDWQTQIYAYRTQYIGDNSKVSNICSLLPMPQTLKGNGIELQTDEPPYQLTMYYSTDPENEESLKNDLTYFYYSSVILFSLVENLDTITLSINGEEYASTTREWAEDLMKADIWNESQTVEKFVKLLDTFMLKYLGTSGS